MREHLITFSTPMVRAILEGRKSQTRRIIVPRSPKYEVGDLLRIKETWCSSWMRGAGGTIYKSDGKFIGNGDHKKGPHYNAETGRDLIKWRSPRYLPKWATRIVRVVTAVREEKLHKISIDDIIAEGIDLEENEDCDRAEHFSIAGAPIYGVIPERYAFFCAWDRINGKRAPSKTNPTVRVITFGEVTT